MTPRGTHPSPPLGDPLDLSFLDSPLELALVAILSMVGFVFFLAGTRSRNPAWVLYGLAASVPTFALRSPVAWAIAAGLTGAGFWLRRFMGG
ncbi:hypothetical protein [Vulgatibacter incomptus]|nr:hypothetical protein [Vulgatibacter incomptus]